MAIKGIASVSNDSILKVKSMAFAKRIVKLYQFLTLEKQEYIMSKQVLRSGTSIGANIAEAIYGSSRKDFVAKLYILWYSLLILVCGTPFLNSDENEKSAK